MLALFDLDAGTYDTGSRFDLPPDQQRNLDRINVTRGRLEVSYTSNRRVSRIPPPPPPPPPPQKKKKKKKKKKRFAHAKVKRSSNRMAS